MKKLKTLIDIRHISQKELAEITGVTEATISRYIKGIRFPDVNFVIKVCKEFHVSADWLLDLL